MRFGSVALGSYTNLRCVLRARARVNEKRRHCGKDNRMNGTKCVRIDYLKNDSLMRGKSLLAKYKWPKSSKIIAMPIVLSVSLLNSIHVRPDFKMKQLFGLTIFLSSPQFHVRCMHYVIQLAEMLCKMSYTCWRHT